MASLNSSDSSILLALSRLTHDEWAQLWHELSTRTQAELEIKISCVSPTQEVQPRPLRGKSRRRRSFSSFSEKLSSFRQQESTIKEQVQKRKQQMSKNKYIPRMSSGAIKPLRSIPLLLPNDCFVDSNGHCHVRENTPRTCLKLNPEALAAIRAIEGPVGVLSIAGPARTGKSYVMGRVVGRQVFSLGHKMDPETMGVWMCSEPFQVQTEFDGVMQDLNVLCLDTEGIWAVARGAQLDNDSKVLQFSILVGSYFVYNTKNVAMEQDIDFLFLVLQLASRILDCDNVSDLQKKEHAPDFMYLLRDLELEPMIENELVSVRQYMLDQVLYSNGLAVSPREMKKAQIRQGLVNFFHSFDAEGLPMPHHDKNVMRRLGEESVEVELKPKFRRLCADVVERIRGCIRPKRSLNGQVLTGMELAAWIETCANALNSGTQPQLESSWNEVVNRVYDQVIEQCHAMFRDLFQNVVSLFPVETDRLSQCAEESVARVTAEFGTKVKSVFQVDVNEVKLTKLMDLIMEHTEAMDAQNHIESESACRELTSRLRAKHLGWLNEDVTPSTDITELLRSMAQLDSTYQRESVGPRKQAVWDEFESEVWKDVENFRAHLEQVQGFDADIKNHLKSIEDERRKGHQLTTQLSEQRAETERTNRRLNMEVQKAQSLSNQISQQQASISNLQRSVSAEQAKVQQYSSQVSQYSSQLSSMRSSNASLSAQLTHARNNVREVHHHHHHHHGGGGGCVVQ